MIALLRSTDGNPDSRFEKYTNFLSENNIPHITICWDRYGVKVPSENNLYYKRISKYGLGVKNIVGLIGFNWFVLKTLIKTRKKYNVIHAADFDTIIPAIWMKILFRKKVIYDIYDWYIDSRGLFNSKLKYIIQIFEFFNIKLSDMVIICEPEREKQIIYKAQNLKVLPNIPNFKQQRNNDFSTFHKLTIAYVGVLGGNRGLSNLLKLAYNNKFINIEIGGFGPLEDEFKDAASKLPNLTFHGKMNYDDALDLMSNANLIYAVYERNNPNHILAAPNKYYEGLYLGKPIITTIGTLVGDKVEKYNTGFAIDEQYDSLQSLIDSISISELQTIANNASNLWHRTYKDYVNNFLNSTYLPFIKSDSKNA